MQGNNANFQLVISEINNTANIDEQTLAQYTGYNGVSICVVIDNHIYWIQICNADTEHQSQEFLSSLVLNGVIEEPTNNNVKGETNTNPTSESYNDEDEEIREIPNDDVPGSPRKYYGQNIYSYYYTDENGQHYYSYEDRKVYDL